jgi:cyclopropane fatty-acyl-phospholipid synthase-like methyltransferase
MKKLTDFVTFNDQVMAKKYSDGRSKIPMSDLFEGYFDGKLDLKVEINELLDHRQDIVNYDITGDHLKFFFTRMIPEVAIHSKAQDERIVREHYDRGNDFFGAFLGERMVYTCGIFEKGPGKETLEEVQDNKLDLVCRKLMLKKGETLLDIGCGWGTLARYAAKYFGTDSTGITIAEKQTQFGNDRIKQWNLEERARILCLDYRDIPRRQYDKISSLEMVEHVGVKNFQKFCDQAYEMLADDGLFLLQWTGLRRGGGQGVPVIGLRPEDLIWGLFMNKYIFSGADASLPLSDVCKGLEKAGFEIHTAENISVHYAHTIDLWHKNWVENREQILRTYGERWYRIWNIFLAWSVRIGLQGNAACFQVVAAKNLDHFNRGQFIGRAHAGDERATPNEPRARREKTNGHVEDPRPQPRAEA